MCNTLDEECVKRFQKARTIQTPSDTFSQHILRAMCALLIYIPSLSETKIVVADGGKLARLIDHRNNELKIDQRWLTYDGIYEAGYCEGSSGTPVASSDMFSCDHAIRILWDRILLSFEDLGERRLDFFHLRELTYIKIEQMPRNVRLETNLSRNELVVLWTSIESCTNQDKPMRVTLHSFKCETRTDRVTQPYHQTSQGKITFKSSSYS